MDSGQPAGSGSGSGPQTADPLDIFIKSVLNQSLTSDELSTDQPNITLSAEEQSQKMNSIAEIFQLEEDDPNEDEEMLDEEGEEAESVVDLEDQRRRTERLKGAMSALVQLWVADSDQMDIAVEKLADGSRERKFISSNFRQFATSIEAF